MNNTTNPERDPIEDPATVFEAQGHGFPFDAKATATAPAPVLYTYVVEYVTAAERFARITVTAIDAIDAKHVAEGLEGEVIVTARARRVARAL